MFVAPAVDKRQRLKEYNDVIRKRTVHKGCIRMNRFALARFPRIFEIMCIQCGGYRESAFEKYEL